MRASVLHWLQTYIEAAVVYFVRAAAQTAFGNGNTVHTDTDHIVPFRHGSVMDSYLIYHFRYVHEVTYTFLYFFCVCIFSKESTWPVGYLV